MSVPSAATNSTPAVTVPDDAGRKMWEILCNVGLSLIFLRFAVLQGYSLMATWRLSTALILAKVSTDFVFYLTRSLPKGISFNLYDWVVGLAGTYAIALFQSDATGQDSLLGQAVQVTGLALQIVAMLSLNRSIGIVPANRGIKTQGLYKFVRHPLYCSYTIAFLGYVINQPSTWNIGVYVLALALWVLRLLAEEKFLLQDQQYQEYASRVQSRMIPGVF
ncbi:MAG: methyltransferase family protein [Planctomycetaceae bacterium]